MPARLFLVIVACLALGGCANGLFYQPNHVVYQTPERHHLTYTNVVFHSADGTPLTGWFIPAVGPPLGTVVHLHGNAQNMTAHFSFVDWLPAERFNVFVFDYRGYGQSAGSPDRKHLYEDSLAALQYVATRPDVDPQRLLVLGQSLGGANAIAVLARHDFPGVRAIVIDSTFSSYRTIVRDKIALIPILSLLRWPLSFVVVSNGYSPDAGVKRLPHVPVLFIHGTADTVIPFQHGKTLFALANEPKQFWIVDKGNHTDALTRFRRQYAPLLVDFFNQALEANAEESK